mmetsp:Transcript_53908/g.128395  ORF Transcript_53908/g.128395 Transcript_53908/m.128395 type:complete len:513 (+) Transcript_53908:72-1610(+)|eukprot:CAMPEP_0178391934 /NCGR_PEP_ID=MMETSP0689_2-20121128/11419_1 /TAXON_ID=160604 /ORGANISM="Amphidinium massartii, Strain CS-259" /LENGTH=512 /DNA_ID=CAMNT_0020012493 /DNA_START=1 /DNA_END=1539 /DNA_ORIENTATION=+
MSTPDIRGEAVQDKVVGCATCVTTCWKVAFGVFEIIVLVWAVGEIFPLRTTWLNTVPEHATVLTVQMQGFWGPLHVLVPENCTRFEENDAIVEEMKRANSSGDDAGASDIAEERRRMLAHDLPSDYGQAWAAGFLGAHQSFGKDDGREAGRAASDVHQNETHLTVERCGAALSFEQPTALQYYGAWVMVTGKDTMAELRHTRCRLMLVLIAWCILESVLNFAQNFNLFQVMAERCSNSAVAPDEPYEQLPQDSAADGTPTAANTVRTPTTPSIPAAPSEASLRSRFTDPRHLRRKLCGIVTNFPLELCRKYLTVQGQTSILALFYVYWHEDYYITSYIPGKVLVIPVVLYAVGIPAYVVMMAQQGPASKSNADELAGSDAPSPSPWPWNWGAAKDWNKSQRLWLTVLIAAAITLPCVLLWLVFQANFLWNTGMCRYFTKQIHGLFEFKGGAAYLEEEKLVQTDWKGTEDALRPLFTAVFGTHMFEVFGGAILESILELITFTVSVIAECFDA